MRSEGGVAGRAGRRSAARLPTHVALPSHSLTARRGGLMMDGVQGDAVRHGQPSSMPRTQRVTSDDDGGI
eukprot:3086019-Rhodomonas_salina.1